MAEFIGCPWCELHAQGCRCTTACGADDCAQKAWSLPTLREEIDG